MQHLRTYRLAPALLALSLVLTAAAPLVRHSCGMTEQEMATKPCCHDKAQHHDAPAMPDDAMAHSSSTDTTMPCHESPEAPPADSSPCPDNGPALHDTCCFTADAPTAPAPERVELSPTALVAFVAAFVTTAPPSADTHAPPADTSPPAPIALHLLYGTFLT